MLSPAGVRSGALVTESSAVTAKLFSTRTAENDSAAKPGTESATESNRNARPARSTDTTKADAVTAEPMPGVLPAATVSLSQAAPATVIVSPVAQSWDEQAQLAQTEFSAALSTNHQAAVASTTFDTYAMAGEIPRYHAEAVSSTIQQIAGGSETPLQQRQTSPVSSLSSTPASAHSETESVVADNVAPPPFAMLAEGGNPTEILASARSLPEPANQAAIRNANPAEALATSKESSPKFARDYQPAQALAPSTNLKENLPASPALSTALAPEQSLMQTSPASQSADPGATSGHLSSSAFNTDQTQTQALGRSQNLSQAAETNLNSSVMPATNPASSPAIAPEQSLPQTSASSKSLVPGAATGHLSPSTFNPDQTRTQAFVPSQNPGQAAETNLNSSVMPAISPDSSPTSVTQPIRTQSFAPSQNPIAAHVVSQIHTQATVPITNAAETLAINQATSQTPDSNQHQTPTFVQGHEQVSIQQGNQSVNVVTAPIPGDGLNPLPATSIVAAQSDQLLAVSPILGKQGSTSSGKTLTLESLRGNSSSAQPLSHPNEVQSIVPAADASAMARALAGTGGTVNTSGERAGASSVAATGPDSREAFATLDATGTPAATTWTHAGTQRAEAGYQDPTLGWVGVRADQSGGGVHAQLVPGSADAAQALGSHLEGLNAYLTEHHTPVETLTLTAPEGGWSGSGSGQGTGEGMQQGAGQQSAQSADASTLSGQSSQPVIQSQASSAQSPAFLGDMDGITQTASLDGYHISVMA